MSVEKLREAIRKDGKLVQSSPRWSVYSDHLFFDQRPKVQGGD